MNDHPEPPAILAFPEPDQQVALRRARYAATHPPWVVARALSIRASKECLSLVQDFLPYDSRADADELFRDIIEAALAEFRGYYLDP